MRLLNRALSSIIVLACILGGCSDDGTTPPPDGSDSSLIFTREDSSIVEFPAAAETYVWCEDWEPDEIPVPSLHVWIGTWSPGEAYLWLRAVIGDIEIGEPMRFPNYFIWDQPDTVSIFLYDPPNELATDTEESSGFITFHELPCPDGIRVDFTIDAVVGSEFGDMPSVAVQGRFTEEITEPPPGWNQALHLP